MAMRGSMSGRGIGSHVAVGSSGSRLLRSAGFGVPSHFLSNVRRCSVQGWVSNRVSNWVCNSLVGKRSLCGKSVSNLLQRVCDPSQMIKWVYGVGMASRAVRAAWTAWHMACVWSAPRVTPLVRVMFHLRMK